MVLQSVYFRAHVGFLDAAMELLLEPASIRYASTMSGNHLRRMILAVTTMAIFSGDKSVYSNHVIHTDHEIHDFYY